VTGSFILRTIGRITTSPLIDPWGFLLTEGRGQIENLPKKKHARKSHEGVKGGVVGSGGKKEELGRSSGQRSVEDLRKGRTHR
jgi:hypothetical protein